MKLPLSCRFILQWASSWGTSTCLPAQLRLQYSEHPAIPLFPGQTSELLSQAIPYCTADCYWVWNKKTNPKQIKAIYTLYIYLLTCTSSRNEDKQSAVLRQTCEFQLNLCCKVWKSLSCIHFLLSFYNSMQKRIKPQKKGLVKQSYAMEWVNTKVSTGFSSISVFAMSAKVTICWQTKQRRKSSFLLCFWLFTPAYLSSSVWHCLQPAAVVTKKGGP